MTRLTRSLYDRDFEALCDQAKANDDKVPPYTGGTFLTFQSLDCHLTDLILTCRDSFLQNL